MFCISWNVLWSCDSFGGDGQNVILALISCLEIIGFIVFKKLSHSFQKGLKKIGYSCEVRESPCLFFRIRGTGNIKTV